MHGKVGTPREMEPIPDLEQNFDLLMRDIRFWLEAVKLERPFTDREEQIVKMYTDALYRREKPAPVKGNPITEMRAGYRAAVQPRITLEGLQILLNNPSPHDQPSIAAIQEVAEKTNFETMTDLITKACLIFLLHHSERSNTKQSSPELLALIDRHLNGAGTWKEGYKPALGIVYTLMPWIKLLNGKTSPLQKDLVSILRGIDRHLQKELLTCYNRLYAHTDEVRLLIRKVENEIREPNYSLTQTTYVEFMELCLNEGINTTLSKVVNEPPTMKIKPDPSNWTQEAVREELRILISPCSKIPSYDECEARRAEVGHETGSDLLLHLAYFTIQEYVRIPGDLKELISKHLHIGKYQSIQSMEFVALGTIQVLMHYIRNLQKPDPRDIRYNTAVQGALYRSIEFIRKIPKEPINQVRENLLSLTVMAYNEILSPTFKLSSDTDRLLTSYLSQKHIDRDLTGDNRPSPKRSVRKRTERPLQDTNTVNQDLADSVHRRTLQRNLGKQTAKASKPKAMKSTEKVSKKITKAKKKY